MKMKQVFMMMKQGILCITLATSLAWAGPQISPGSQEGKGSAAPAAEANPEPETPAAGDLDSIARRAEAAREAMRLKEAVDLYRETVRLRPSWIEGWWYLGTLQFEVLNFEEALKVFGRLASLEPERGLAWAMSGLCEFELRRYPSALENLEKGLRLGLPLEDEITRVARHHTALLLNRFGRFEESSRVLKDLTKETERHAGTIEALGISRLSLPLLPSEVPPQKRELVFKMGNAAYYGVLGSLEDARREYRGLISRYPNESRVRLHYGIFLLSETGETDAAIRELEQGAQLAPQDPETHRVLARAYAKAGRKEEAERELEEASRQEAKRQSKNP